LKINRYPYNDATARTPSATSLQDLWGYPWATGITLVAAIAFLIGSIIDDTTYHIVNISH
jgi:hypothetical protein